MRLIDADKCPCNECTMFCDKNCCDAFVKWRKGCDYDINNIIKQLEDNSLRAKLNAFEFSMSKHSEPIIADERNYGEFRAYETAINIVKGASDETD